MSEQPRDETTRFDYRYTGWTIDDLVEEVERFGDDPEEQYYYVTYSDVFHTTPRCPHIQDAKTLHVTGQRSRLNGPLMAGENRVAGPTDEHCDLRECGWCEENSGYHPMEHPDRGRSKHEDTDTAEVRTDGGKPTNGELQTKNPPLAGFCSLCGDGYSPHLKIEISDEPIESKNGSTEYRWCHKQCKRDHGRVFIRATPEDGWDLPL